ncbi:MAG: sensor histidine kinase, partial [Microbispora sp.]|nr:sensor histidine kinase [Microbispora sp.]
STAVYMLLNYAYGPVFLSPIIVMFNAVQYGHRRAAWLSAAASFLFVVVYATWLIPHRASLFHHTAVAAYLLLTLTVAEFYRMRRERLAERERVAQEEARRQASEERLTMAQELHDVLAHNISLIHVQASTALHLLDDHPEQARTALTAIKQASKDVLTEMRGVLSLLRDGAPRSPTAGMAYLSDLIERSGLPVTLEVAGRERPLPAGVDRAGYRIVQESLTNVTRHAPGSRVTVRVTYAPEELIVVVEDDGSGTARAEAGLGGGNGIPGMRERAAALGGSLMAGPRPGGGFRVEARLPFPPSTEQAEQKETK